jgi:PAT family beta-lactamase induction signal transducer AmpG
MLRSSPRPTLADSWLLRWGVFAALYLAQGVPWGFLTVSYTVLLADLGLDAGAIGAAVGLAYVPWSFKIVFGPLLDAVPPWPGGRRRPFLVAAQVGMALTLLALVAFDPRTSLGIIGGLLFLHNTFAALQDVATDAMAVDALPDAERGRANAFMWAGKSLGVMAGGGGGLLVAKAFGWEALLLAQVGLLALILLLPLLLLEHPPRPDEGPVRPSDLARLLPFLLPLGAVVALVLGLGALADRWGDPAATALAILQPFVACALAIGGWALVDREGPPALWRGFGRSGAWGGLLVGVLTPIGYALVSAASTKLLRSDLGLSEESLATLNGAIDPVSGVVGALAGGVLADRWGVRRGVLVAMVGIATGLGTFALAPSLWSSFAFLAAWTFFLGFWINAYSASTLGLFMGLADPRVGATMFAVFMATTNLTYAWTAPAGGALADRFGYVALFATAAAVQVLAVPSLWALPARIQRPPSD